MAVNLYGTGDNFFLEPSHILPALIRMLLEAKEAGKDHVVGMGDGSPTHECLYFEDAAEDILLAAEEYIKNGPVNLGSVIEISAEVLPTLIVRLTRFDTKIVRGTTKPNLAAVTEGGHEPGESDILP
jgi:GDP-L-fucose synthase